MNRKTVAIILELIPIISAPLTYLLIVSDIDFDPIKKVIPVTMLLAFLGFVFFFIGRKIDREDRAVRILGILDWFATVFVIGIYVIAIFSMGL